ncbi:MAG TPA: hypothetical protein VLS93_05140, partial [Anaeromyxobacteraceae bacterium]|nr:hypothetical protein [Anaeromyxobacteraceae bacterium]
MPGSRREPTVRIRCAPEDEARCRAALGRAGLGAERSLTWLVVRDADPDAVNEALAAGGARPRVAVRERIGRLVGWVLDHGADLDGRAATLRTLVGRVLEDGGLLGRYAPAGEAALLAGARALQEHLMATGAGLLAWDRFVALF